MNPSKKVGLLTVLIISFSKVMFCQNNVEQELQTVLTAETVALQSRNFEGWKQLWVQSKDASHHTTGNFYNYDLIGWDTIVSTVKQFVFSQPAPGAEVKINYSNFQSLVNGKFAWADYDKEMIYGDSLEKSYANHETVFLERENNVWKIRSVRQIDKQNVSSTEPAQLENEINALGYNLLTDKKYEQAIAVFKLNVQFFPGSWNVYDSLGEAYLASGDKALAKENYSQSVKLNPQNSSGKKALEQLQ